MATAAKTIKSPRKSTKANVVPIKETHDLADHAMLATLKRSRWLAKATDAEATNEVAENHDADAEAMNLVKKLMPKGALDPINSILSKALTQHNRRTLPWFAGGTGILTNVGFMPYMAKFRELKAALEVEKQVLKGKYNDCKNQSKKRLGSLYRESDYPSIDDLMNKIDIKVSIMPIPSGSDFRVKLSDDTRRQIQREIEQSIQDQLAEVTKEPYRRVAKLAAKMVDRLNLYKVNDDGKKENTFKDTLVNNIRDLVELLPSLNILHDKQLDDMAQLLKDELLQYQAEELRTSPVARQQTAEAAKKILDHVQAFI